MAKRTKRDSQQEIAVAGDGAKQRMLEAVKVSQNMRHDITSDQLREGMWIVGATGQGGRKVLTAILVEELDWSRRKEWVKVNNRMVYSIGGRVEILFTKEEVDAVIEQMQEDFHQYLDDESTKAAV